MKALIKSMIPASLRPAVRRVRGGISSFQRRWLGRKKPSYRMLGQMPDSVLRVSVGYNKYGAYCVPLTSWYRPAVQTILAGRVHEPETLALLVAHQAGDVIHAGTYFGAFLPALSHSRAEAAMVWAFEPNPESYRCARMTLELNQLTNVELLQAGLAERQSTASLVTCDRDGRALGGASHIVTSHSGEVERSGTYSTQLVSIDQTVPDDREVAVVQLDVEEYEQQALSGAMETIRRCRPIIVLETLPERSWLETHLYPLGYRLDRMVGANSVLTCARV